MAFVNILKFVIAVIILLTECHYCFRCEDLKKITEMNSNLTNNIIENAAKAANNLLLEKSRLVYKDYETFHQWKLKNEIITIDETVLLAYFQELSEKFCPASLWTKYSILKSTLIVNENIDISQFSRLVAFLKMKSKGYIPKKSKVLTAEQVHTFINEAPDEIHLLHKVVLIMGGFGGLRRDELVKMSIEDIEDKGSCLLVKIPETKTGMSKGFSIVEEEKIGALGLVRKYISLRPSGVKNPRFFLTFRNGRCTIQPVGKITIGSVPSMIAKYLKLDNANEYTGHCLRRTSATLLTEAGASYETLKIHGRWKSASVAEGYIKQSIFSKNKISTMIVNSVTESHEFSSGSLVNELPSTCGRVFAPQVSKTSQDSRLKNFSGKFENCTFNFN